MKLGTGTGMLVFLLLSIPLVNSDSNYAIWENQYARLSVFPNCSVSSEWHLQYANITNKMATDQVINWSFVFPEELELGQIQYLGQSVNGSPIWINCNDLFSYLEHNGKHYYYALNINFQANSNRYVRWVYKTQTPTGKWDLIIWRGGILNPTLLWELDPYWGVGDSPSTNTDGIYYYSKWGQTDGQISNWYDNETTLWKYRRLITISNQSNAVRNYSSYQVNVTLSNANANANQFRVVFYNQSDFYEVPSWTEILDANTVNVWFMINFSVAPFESGMGNKTQFFIYYGNTSVSDRDYADNVFLLFDHFDNTTLDTAKWDESGAGSVTISNSVARIETSGGDEILESDLYFGSSVRTKWSGTIGISSNNYHAVGFYGAPCQANFYCSVGLGTPNMSVYAQDGGGWENTIISYLGNTEHVYEVRRNSSNGITHIIDDILIAISTKNPTNNMNFWAKVDQVGDAERDHTIDWVFVAKYDEIEPVVSLGVEADGTPSVSVNTSVDFSDLQVDTLHSINITFTEISGENSITVSTYSSNHSDYTSNCVNVVVPAGSSNTTTLYFTPSIYYDSNTMGEIIWVVDTSMWAVSNNTTIAIGKSTTPTWNYGGGTSDIDWGDIQVDTESALMSFNVSITGSSPNNITFYGIEDLDSRYIIYNTTWNYTISLGVDMLFYFSVVPPIYNDEEYGYDYNVGGDPGRDSEWLIDERYGNIGTGEGWMYYKSTTPVFIFFNSSEHGDIQVTTEHNLSFTLYLSDFSCPNNITLLAYSTNSSEFGVYFNVSVINGSQNVSYNMWFIPASYIDSPLHAGMHTFSVDETYGAIDNESVMVNHTGYSSTPNLTYSIQNIDFGDIQVDTESGQMYLNLTNEGSVNDIILTGITLNSNFTDANNSFNYDAWIAKDSDRSWRAISLSSTGQYQTAVVSGGQIYISDDYGATWTAKDNRNWLSVSLSSTGQYQTAGVSSGNIYISDDYGNTWTAKDSARIWESVSLSSTGQYQTAVVYNGQIYTSDDYGHNWTAKDSNREWKSVSLSSTSQYQTAVVHNGQIYISSDYGVTWIVKDSNREWRWVSLSDSGQYQTAITRNEYIYISDDYGNTWTAKDSIRQWRSVSLSSTGQYQTAIVWNGQIYISDDYGATWTAKDNNRNWLSVSISDSGQYQTAVVEGGQIYILYNEYTISANSYLELYFTAIPPFYTDNTYNSTFNFTIDTTYGVISQDSAYLSYTSTTPTLIYYNTSDFADCQVAVHSVNLTILVTLGDFSCPNNVSLLAYHVNHSEFTMYFNLSTVNGSQNVSYSVYWTPSQYYNNDVINSYTFSVDETYGAIDNESFICPYWGYSSTPYLQVTSDFNATLDNLVVVNQVGFSYINISNNGTSNNITITDFSSVYADLGVYNTSFEDWVGDDLYNWTIDEDGIVDVRKGTLSTSGLYSLRFLTGELNDYQMSNCSITIPTTTGVSYWINFSYRFYVFYDIYGYFGVFADDIELMSLVGSSCSSHDFFSVGYEFVAIEENTTIEFRVGDNVTGAHGSYPYAGLNVYVDDLIVSPKSFCIQPGEHLKIIMSADPQVYGRYIELFSPLIDETYGNISVDEIYTIVDSPAPNLTYSIGTIYFGNLQVGETSDMDYLNLTNLNSPNSLSITGIDINSNFTDINNSYSYTISANSYLLMYFTAYAPVYNEDIYNITFLWILDTTYGNITQDSAYLSYYTWLMNYTNYYDWQRSVDEDIHVNLLTIESNYSKNITIYTNFTFLRNDDNVFSIGSISEIHAAIYVDNVTLGLDFDIYNPNCYGIAANMSVRVYLRNEDVGVYYLTDADTINITYSNTFYWDGSVVLSIIDVEGMHYPAYLTLDSMTLYHINASNRSDEANWTYLYTYEWPIGKSFVIDRILDMATTSLHNDSFSMCSTYIHNNYFHWDAEGTNLGSGYTQIASAHSLDGYGSCIHNNMKTYWGGYGSIDLYVDNYYYYDITTVDENEIEDLRVKLNAYSYNFTYDDAFFDGFLVQFYLVDNDGDEERAVTTHFYDTNHPQVTVVAGNRFYLNEVEIINPMDGIYGWTTIDEADEILIKVSAKYYFYHCHPYPGLAPWSGHLDSRISELKVDSVFNDQVNEQYTFDSNILWNRNGTESYLVSGDAYDIVITMNNITNTTMYNNYTAIVLVSTDQGFYNVTFCIESIVPTVDYSITLNDLGIITVGFKNPTDFFIWSETMAWVEWTYNFTGDYWANWTTDGFTGLTNNTMTIYNPDYVNIINVTLHIYTDDPNNPYFNVSIWARIEPLYTSSIDFGNTSQAYRVFEVYNTYGHDDISCRLGFNGIEEFSYTTTSSTSYFVLTLNKYAELTFTTQNKHTVMTFKMKKSGGTPDIYYQLNDGSWHSISGIGTDWTDIVIDLTCVDDNDNFQAENIIAFDIQTGADWVDILLTDDTSSNYSTRFFDGGWYSSTLNLKHDLWSRDVWFGNTNFNISAGDFEFTDIYYMLSGSQYTTESIEGNITLTIFNGSRSEYRMIIYVPFEVRPAYGDYVIIISNMEDLSVVVYYGEENSFEIEFTNVGTLDDSVTNLTVSLDWVAPVYYFKDLDSNVPVNITFDVEDFDANLIGESVYMSLILQSIHGVTYEEYMYVSVEARSIITVTPLVIDRERDQDEDIEFSITITNTGLASANISISLSANSMLGAELSFKDEDDVNFDLAAGESKIVWFVISGKIADTDDSWTITVEETNTDVSYSVSVACKTGGEKIDVMWIWLLMGLAGTCFVVGGIARMPNEEQRVIKNDIKTYSNDQSDKYDENKAYEEEKKLSTQFKAKNALGWPVVGLGLAVMVIAFYLVLTGEAYNPLTNKVTSGSWDIFKDDKITLDNPVVILLIVMLSLFGIGVTYLLYRRSNKKKKPKKGKDNKKRHRIT